MKTKQQELNELFTQWRKSNPNKPFSCDGFLTEAEDNCVLFIGVESNTGNTNIVVCDPLTITCEECKTKSEFWLYYRGFSKGHDNEYKSPKDEVYYGAYLLNAISTKSYTGDIKDLKKRFGNELVQRAIDGKSTDCDISTVGIWLVSTAKGVLKRQKNAITLFMEKMGNEQGAVAYMNLSKFGGGSVADKEKLDENVKAMKDTIIEEIKIIDPMLIVVCGVNKTKPIFDKHFKTEDFYTKTVGIRHLTFYTEANIREVAQSEKVQNIVKKCFG